MWATDVNASYVRMYKGQPGTTTAMIYTAPTASAKITGANGAVATINSITLANTTATAATINIGIGGTAAVNQIVPTVTVPPNDTKLMAGLSIALLSAETLHALQGTASAITVTISGDEYA